MSSALSKARTAANILTHLGPRWCAFRLQYAAKKRLGFFERKWPIKEWRDYPLEHLLLEPSAAQQPEGFLAHRLSSASPRFFFAPTDRPVYSALLTSRFSPPGDSF